MSTKNIAFLVGGYSGEFEISLKSAHYAESQLVSDQFVFYKIIISNTGWYHEEPSGKKQDVNKDDFSILVDGQKILFDAAFILIHGTPGEDGLIQSYLDLMNIPYPSCGHLSSAITFDKKISNTLVQAHGISVANSLLLKKGESYNLASITKDVSLPVFVKPNQGGSSLGTFKVVVQKDLVSSINSAFDVGEEVLVEEFIPGREFTVGVMEWEGKLLTLPITEVVAPNEFFDFEAKYTVGGCDEITPANITKKMQFLLEESAKQVYRIFGCKGIVRVDYIWHNEKDLPYFLEVNTIPGVTETSFIPQQLDAMGWTLQKVFLALLSNLF